MTWLVADVLRWAPARTYAVWHDRAVFHFLTAEESQRHYLRALHAATTLGAVAIFGCFALDGPSSCSGLPVDRYDAANIAERLGERWQLVADDREEHTTPDEVVQPFTWAALRRRSSPVAITIYGVFAVSFMMVMCALESRNRHVIAAFALGCALSSSYEFLAGTCLFGVVEGVWTLVALRRYWSIKPSPAHPSPPT